MEGLDISTYRVWNRTQTLVNMIMAKSLGISPFGIYNVDSLHRLGANLRARDCRLAFRFCFKHRNRVERHNNYINYTMQLHMQALSHSSISHTQQPCWTFLFLFLFLSSPFFIFTLLLSLLLNMRHSCVAFITSRVGVLCVRILVCRISVYTKYVCMLNYPTDYSLNVRKMCSP